MNEFILQSAYFGVLLTLATYFLGRWLSQKIKSPLMNPLLFSIAAIIGILLLGHIPYESYENGAALLSYLLTPATVCLAVPLYRQIEHLRRNWRAILCGVISGILANAGAMLLLALIFGLGHREYVTLLPKSVSGAIGMPLSAELGGYATITMVMISLTGIFGNIFAEKICRLFHIEEPMAKGTAVGSASHVFGTAKALEMGELEGAMSSLSLVVSGLLTVIAAAVFANFL